MPQKHKPNQFGRIFAPDEAWLAQRPPEPILDPGLAIIDTHHHLWIRDGHRYLLDEYLADVATGHNLISSVFLQCHSMYRADGPQGERPLGETEFVTGQAAMSASGMFGTPRVAAGIVGFVDLTLGDRVEPLLEAHMRAAGGRFRGVRDSGNYDIDPIIGNGAEEPRRYLRPAFRAGLKVLTKLGLSLDAWTFFTQMEETIELARACPDANIIMGHCGGLLGYGPYSGRKDEIFATWKARVKELAKCPNVSMKLGGMMMRLAAFDYLAMDVPPTSEQLAGYWRPYIETCIEAFGPDRCLFESNFPVDKMAIGWAALWNAFKRISAGASQAEKTALFSGTAKRVYRL
ncbi:MAG TPA: amidohydrolase family protein [Acetobacteraceae bacterium]|jgi:L-fuconolactonase|nr:amidohydrolase family protein [Acetobacteraceae bacterium]